MTSPPPGTSPPLYLPSFQQTIRIPISYAQRISFHPPLLCIISLFFFFNDTATTEIYTLSLHDALPISLVSVRSVSVASFTGLVTAAAMRTLVPAGTRRSPMAEVSSARPRYLG